MNKHKKVSSKEIGLEIGVIISKYFYNKEHLHYGYWTDDLQIVLPNLPQAQENHSNLIISHIPEGVTTILDVGCGVGRFALKLTDLGYKVDCVSPSSMLAGHARNLLGNKSHVFECDFENLQTDSRYDVILFSESFQYVNLEKALQNSLKFLNGNGFLLICDFFKLDAKGENYFGGGHKLVKFYNLISQYPFKSIKDIDITRETAPTMDIANDLIINVGYPIWNLVMYYLNSNYRLIYKFIQWKYKEKMKKINKKYFSGAMNSKNFSIFKSYRILLYKKVNGQ